MDSLDTWLNTQCGWRHFAVAWLMALPLGIALGGLWVSTTNWIADWHSTGPTALRASAASEHLALGVAASVPFAVLLFSVETLSRRRPAKRGKNRMPRYLWRGTVGLYLAIADGTYSVWARAQPPQWQQRHDSFYVFLAGMCLYPIALALFFWNIQYSGRLKRQAAEAAANDLGSLLRPQPQNRRVPTHGLIIAPS